MAVPNPVTVRLTFDQADPVLPSFIDKPLDGLLTHFSTTARLPPDGSNRFRRKH